MAHPSSSLLCGRRLLVFWAQHCFCSSSLHHGQVYSPCWCGRPGKWKTDTSCQAKEGPSSLSLHANVDRKEKKGGGYCESLQWHRLPDLTNGQWKLASSCQRELTHLARTCGWSFRIFASADCSSSSLNIKTQMLLYFATVAKHWTHCPPDVFTIWLWTWSITALVSIGRSMGQGKEGRSDELWGLSTTEQALPDFPWCDVERVSAPQTFCLHSRTELNANQGGTAP